MQTRHTILCWHWHGHALGAAHSGTNEAASSACGTIVVTGLPYLILLLLEDPQDLLVPVERQPAPAACSTVRAVQDCQVGMKLGDRTGILWLHQPPQPSEVPLTCTAYVAENTAPRESTRWGRGALLLAKLDCLASVLGQEHLVTLLNTHGDCLSILKVWPARPDCHYPALAHLAQKGYC